MGTGIGGHHRRVLPVCGTIGSLLVTLSDFIARTVFSPIELSVGIVVSIIGIPYFVYLLFRTRT